ncbi:hypothetical protein HAX54_014752 [Datura stramonium]|uniref:HMA domain-containing protein n=1 Tax=Datura stramonium TaxID=4076 RepID=A0ABS8TNJ1_DATST|nr:hypothetical protein [Datura stramonium]
MEQVGRSVGEEEKEKKKVMVAIDESECSLYALEWALQNLNQSLLNAEVVLFTAQPIADYSYIYASSFGVTSPELMANVQENQRKVANALLKKAKDVCTQHAIDAETVTQVGDPKATICEAAEKLHVNLLVVGSNNKGALQRAFLGSVSNYCVHNAKCPVLVENNNMKEKESKNEKNNNNNPKGIIIILGVYIHCQGCKEQVIKSLRGFDGVEEIEIDEKNHKVVVKGKKADPLKVAERLRRKTGKHVELISPIPHKKKEEEKKEKKQELKVIEVILKLYLHCEGCAKDVKQCIHKMPGVQTVDPELKNNLVKVKGSMDPQKLVEFINKRAGRHAEIISKIEKEKNEKTISDKKSSDIRKGGTSCQHDYLQFVYAPQFFSDENPNSCSIL